MGFTAESATRDMATHSHLPEPIQQAVCPTCDSQLLTLIEIVSPKESEKATREPQAARLTVRGLAPYSVLPLAPAVLGRERLPGLSWAGRRVRTTTRWYGATVAVRHTISASTEEIFLQTLYLIPTDINT